VPLACHVRHRDNGGSADEVASGHILIRHHQGSMDEADSDVHARRFNYS